MSAERIGPNLRVPSFVQDAASWGAARLNDILFRSRPPGDPVPQQPGSWSFSVIGDYGAGTRNQAEVAESLLARRPELVLTTGDNVYEAGLEEEYRRNFDPPHLFGTVRTQLPVHPSIGNHDLAGGTLEPYFRRFPETGGRRYYSFEHRGISFFSLDSNQPLLPGSRQWKWLDTALGQAGDGWKVVYMHHPLLSGQPGRSRPDLLEHLGPMLARHGVDLLFAGHDHSYDRSRPINSFGTLQITTGNGGRMLYPYLSRQPDWSAYRDVAFGHVNVEVGHDRMVVRHVLSDGRVGDTHVVARDVDRPSTPAAQIRADGVHDAVMAAG